jgi:hypothetical protein
MKNLDFIADELFNKIRGRFPSITIGNDKGEVTNMPKEARFFDFDYVEGEKSLGKVSISLDEDTVSVMYSNDFVENEDTITRQNWYEFLKELRQFSRKRLLNFDTRNITKSNLNKRDYKFLAQNRPGEDTMLESKMYGTSRTSYQDVGAARLAIKHSQPINQMMPAGRTQHIESIYIESAEGERFKYPYRHLNGARAMARHVSEGGKPFDDFGSHITSLSEELSKLKKFKTYMGRSSVMAEGLSGYLDAVHERIDVVRTTIRGLQRENFYKETFANFEVPVMEDVPEDVAENWIDQLTIRQFNEELKDVFPYIYRLVSEHTKAKELGPDDLLGEGPTFDKFTSGIKTAAGAVGDAIFGSEDEAKSQDILAKFIVTQTGDKTAAGRVYASCKGNELECLYSYIKEKGLRITPEVQQIVKKYNLKGNANMQVDSVDQDKGIQSSIERIKGAFQEFESWAEDLESGALASGDDTEEGNAYANAVRQAKMQGKTKGDKIPHPNGDDEITLEKKVPVTEFVLSLYDRNTGTFPKGETAVLTAIEKDYGEQFIEPAKQFIERINQTFEQHQMRNSSSQFDPEFERMRELAGLR